MARFISRAREAVCYVGPGIHVEPARAIAQVARDLGPEMISVSLDFDERVMRMGFGSVEAASLLRTAGIVIQHVPGLRSALVIVDGEGFVFTPTPLYLEAEPRGQQAFNALRLSHEQVSEGMARLSPAAKAIAVARSDDPQEKSRLVSIPVEMSPSEVGDLQFQE